MEWLLISDEVTRVISSEEKFWLVIYILLATKKEHRQKTGQNFYKLLKNSSYGNTK